MSMPDRARIDRALRAARRRKRMKPTETSAQAASMLPNFTPEAAPASESTTKGEGPGHPFRGNQYVRGRRGGSGGGLSISHSKLAAPDQAAPGSAEQKRINDRKRALVTLEAQTKTSRAFQFVDGKQVPVTVGTRERPISAIRAGHSLLDDENLVRRVRDVQGSGNIQTIRLDPIPARPSGGIASITGPRSMMVRRVVTKKPYIGSDRSPLPEPKRFGGDLIAAGVELVSRKSTYAVTKSVDEKRFTFGPLYIPDVLDAHSEYVTAEDLQKALWGFVEKTGSDRTIFLQHTDKPAGRWVEACTWPTEVQVELALPHAVRKAGEPTTRTVHLPPGTTFLGVIWEPWAWELVKKGQLRGYSLGGKARKERVEVGLERAANLTKDLTTITTPSGTQIRVPSRVAKRLDDILKGEGPGHPFRGNQYVRVGGGPGMGGSATPPPPGGSTRDDSSVDFSDAGYGGMSAAERAEFDRHYAAAVLPDAGDSPNPGSAEAVRKDNEAFIELAKTNPEAAYIQTISLYAKTGGEGGKPLSKAELREYGIDTPANITKTARAMVEKDAKIKAVTPLDEAVKTNPALAAAVAKAEQRTIAKYQSDIDGLVARSDGSAPDMLIMGGPGGVGKSSALKAYPDKFGVKKDPPSHVTLNPDDVKRVLIDQVVKHYPPQQLAGLSKDDLMAVVHGPSVALMSRIEGRALAARVPIIHDRTMGAIPEVQKYLDGARANGYAAPRAALIETPIRASVRNAFNRSVRPGDDQRHIPLFILAGGLTKSTDPKVRGRLAAADSWEALSSNFNPNSPGRFWNAGKVVFDPGNLPGGSTVQPIGAQR